MTTGTAVALGFDVERARALLPASHLCPEGSLPRNRPPRLIAAMALGQTLETSFSGSSYHLACAGMQAGTLEGCFSLSSRESTTKEIQIRGAVWKLTRLLRGQGKAGFKFTSAYLDEVWPKYLDAFAGATLVNNFQLYGR